MVKSEKNSLKGGGNISWGQPGLPLIPPSEGGKRNTTIIFPAEIIFWIPVCLQFYSQWPKIPVPVTKTPIFQFKIACHLICQYIFYTLKALFHFTKFALLLTIWFWYSWKIKDFTLPLKFGSPRDNTLSDLRVLLPVSLFIMDESTSEKPAKNNSGKARKMGMKFAYCTALEITQTRECPGG